MDELKVPAKTRAPKKPSTAHKESIAVEIAPDAAPCGEAADAIPGKPTAAQASAPAENQLAEDISDQTSSKNTMPDTLAKVGEGNPENNGHVVDTEVPGTEIEKKGKRKKHKKEKWHHMCKLVKKDYLEKHLSDYADLVTGAAFICRKCGRVSNDMSLLCKPVTLESLRK